MVRTGPKSRNGRNEEEIRYVTSEQQEDKVVGWKKKHLRSGRKKLVRHSISINHATG